MTRIIPINGILTDGEGNVDSAGRALSARGFEVKDPYYPRVNPFSARWRGKRIARQIARWVEPGDVIVAHSFGGYIAAHVSRMVHVEAIYLVAPAMSQHWDWGKAVNPDMTLYCFHSKNDAAIKAGMLMFMHPFGAAGRVGFRYPGVKNVRMNSGHSDYFRTPLWQEIEAIICANHQPNTDHCSL